MPLGTDAYDYELPPSAIAQTPASPRESARLLVALDPAGAVEHRQVRDLPDLLEPGDLLVMNDTRVLPARLRLRKETGGAVEVLLLEPRPDLDDANGGRDGGAGAGGAAGLGGGRGGGADGRGAGRGAGAGAGAGLWEALVRPSRKVPPGTLLYGAGSDGAGAGTATGTRSVAAAAGVTDAGTRSVARAGGAPGAGPEAGGAAGAGGAPGAGGKAGGAPGAGPEVGSAPAVGAAAEADSSTPDPGQPSRPKAGQPVVEAGDVLPGGRRLVRLVGDPSEHGTIPLPPYITEPLRDPERYQTVYANRPGSVAAPTAGLHLSREVLDRCVARGVGVATVELVVGLDTFRPVTEDRPEDHVMHSERYEVSEETMRACREARRVVAVGTTTVRALEAAAATGDLQGRTDLFIHGDYPFRVVDALMTNFHLPRSSLLLLLSAFCGDRWRALYDMALSSGYRFLSFGDAMLVARRPAEAS